MEKMKAYVRYFLEHLEELLLHHGNPTLQAKYFGVIFNEAPTYDDIVSGTPDCSKITGVNEIFRAKKSFSGLMAGSTGSVGNPLLADFVVVGRRLEKLGFIYSRGKVMTIGLNETMHGLESI